MMRNQDLGRQMRCGGFTRSYDQIAHPHRTLYDARIRGGIAQMGERLHGMQEVIGSIPVTSTNQKSYQLVLLIAFLIGAVCVKTPPFTMGMERRGRFSGSMPESLRL